MEKIIFTKNHKKYIIKTELGDNPVRGCRRPLAYPMRTRMFNRRYLTNLTVSALYKIE